MNKKDTFSYKSENESSGFLLWQLNNIWQRQIIKSLKEFNLTHVQFVILTSLYWLETHNEKTTQISIAKFAHADVMMTSKVLRTLEEKKLLERIDDKVDTRAKIIKITEKGEEVIKKAIIKIEEFDHNFFDESIKNTDFNNVLKKLIDINLD